LIILIQNLRIYVSLSPVCSLFLVLPEDAAAAAQYGQPGEDPYGALFPGFDYCA
jgi:hypothetical protein